MLFFCLALFDTTSRALGGILELCWRTSRASHPSEDLSEPPPLLASVAGREDHCCLTGSLRNSLPGLFWDGWGPLGTLFGRLLCEYSPHRWSWRILRIAFRFSHGPSGNVFQLPDMTAGPRYLSKSRERSQVCPLIPLLQPPEPETDIIFSKIPKQIFQRLLSASEQSDH